ncbi:unnamed protein product [Acidithrix sp. C25]|nr:unnamed protein product [Acidithrix sp. C25]
MGHSRGIIEFQIHKSRLPQLDATHHFQGVVATSPPRGK